MRRIKLNFRQLSVTDKIAKARQIIAALTGKLEFPTPSPALASITAAVSELENAEVDVQAARQMAKSKTSARGAKVDVVNRLMSQLSAYVESVGAENEELIRSVGMDTRAVAVRTTGAPDPPSSLDVTLGAHEGEVDVSWDKVRGTRSYIIEQSLDPPTASSWTHAGVAPRSRSTINGLTSGTRYWFRVAAVGTAGQSGWSDPATRIAP